MAKHIKWDDLRQEFLADSECAREYLEAAFEEYQSDDDRSALLKAMRNVAEAQGGLGRLAEVAKVNRENLYRALSENGNPTLETLRSVLIGLGLRIRLEPTPSRS